MNYIIPHTYMHFVSFFFAILPRWTWVRWLPSRFTFCIVPKLYILLDRSELFMWHNSTKSSSDNPSVLFHQLLDSYIVWCNCQLYLWFVLAVDTGSCKCCSELCDLLDFMWPFWFHFLIKLYLILWSFLCSVNWLVPGI